MLCDNPKCLCHPRPEKPFQRLEFLLRGSKSEKPCHLDQPGAQLDVVFDLIGNAMILRETVEDPAYPKASYTIWFTIEMKKMRFVNLIGLPNNSLLLSLRMRSSFCTAKGKNKMAYKEKYQGFSPNRLESRLYNDFYLCYWPEQHLELLLPAERIKGWKTVGLILKTFKQITAENWCHLVDLKKTPRVAGLDWRAIESTVLPEKEESSPATTLEEEKAIQFLINPKTAKKAKKVLQKQAIFVRY